MPYNCQISMSNKLGKPKSFWDLKPDDKDLTMFTISNLTLDEGEDMVFMAMKLKRKVVTELLTTYLPKIEKINGRISDIFCKFPKVCFIC